MRVGPKFPGGPWLQYFKSKNLKPKTVGKQLYLARPELNNKVFLWKGDVNLLSADIVANEEVLERTIINHAKVVKPTPSYKIDWKISGTPNNSAIDLLPNRRFHSVTQSSDPIRLQLSFETLFANMSLDSTKSLIVACKSTSIFGCDFTQLAHIALHSTRTFLSDKHEHVDGVLFCASNDEHLEVYEELFQRYFPV